MVLWPAPIFFGGRQRGPLAWPPAPSMGWPCYCHPNWGYWRPMWQSTLQQASEARDGQWQTLIWVGLGPARPLVINSGVTNTVADAIYFIDLIAPPSDDQACLRFYGRSRPATEEEVSQWATNINLLRGQHDRQVWTHSLLTDSMREICTIQYMLDTFTVESLPQILQRLSRPDLSPDYQAGPYRPDFSGDNRTLHTVQVLGMPGTRYTSGNPGEPPSSSTLGQLRLQVWRNQNEAAMFTHQYCRLTATSMLWVLLPELPRISPISTPPPGPLHRALRMRPLPETASAAPGWYTSTSEHSTIMAAQDVYRMRPLHDDQSRSVHSPHTPPPCSSRASRPHIPRAAASRSRSRS